MISRRLFYASVLTAASVAVGLTATQAAAFTTRDVNPVPFDGKTGGPAYQPHAPGMNCMVVGANCNKGPMPPSIYGGGERWDRTHTERDYPQQPWSRATHDKRQVQY